MGIGLVVVGALAVMACTSSDPDTSAAADGPRYVTTIAPFAMILEPVVQGRGTVVRLLEPGASPHTYDPRPSDLRAVNGSAAVIYGDEHLDAWAADLPGAPSLSLLELLPPTVQRPMPDGHTADPHFWTDPLTVREVLPPLVDSLCALDTDGCSTYRANADTFASRLNTLAGQVRLQMQPVRGMPVMLAQPFFRYFFAAYGPRLVGVVEPQPAKEPSPRQIQALVERVRTDSVRVLFTQRQLPPRSAEVLAESAGLPIHTLDPLGGVEGRTTYETLILYNVRQIRAALEGGVMGSG